MNEKSDFQHFSSTRNNVSLSENQTITVPPFIANAYKRYRFNKSENTLERQCYKCQKWYKVLVLQDQEFIDCHQESEYHYISEKSGYGSYCVKCSTPQTIEKKKFKDLEKYSVFLTRENLRYISIRCAAQDINKTDFINMLIEQESQKNPVIKFI